MNRPVVAVTIGRSHYERMFSEGAWESLDGFAEVVHHDGPEPADRGQLKVVLAGADACITSWGVAQLDAGVLAAAIMPSWLRPRKICLHSGANGKNLSLYLGSDVPAGSLIT